MIKVGKTASRHKKRSADGKLNLLLPLAARQSPRLPDTHLPNKQPESSASL
jgi:hypothetical protein